MNSKKMQKKFPRPSLGKINEAHQYPKSEKLMGQKKSRIWALD